MRKYQAIWEQVKATGRAQVKAAPALHGRIIKAVRKEKSSDLAFRLLTSELNKKYNLISVSVSATIVFTLEDATPVYKLL